MTPRVERPMTWAHGAHHHEPSTRIEHHVVEWCEAHPELICRPEEQGLCLAGTMQ